MVERIWGSPQLGPWYSQPAAGKPIGEVWLTAEECVGEGTGATLAALAARSPIAFGNDDGQGFPLLIKLLFPREKLSVQVHPDDAQARAMLGQPRGKTECWYVLSAEPGAEVALGFRDPITIAEVRAAIGDGTLESKLHYLPVKAGDMVFVDANTVHAIGPGVVVLETQQYSDVTYRLWDYGRPRELHLEAGLAVARTDTSAGKIEAVEMGDFTRLVSCAYFSVDRFALMPGVSAPLDNTPDLQILIALGEGASVTFSGGLVPLLAGRAVVLPAEDTLYTLTSTGPVDVIRVLR
jgi:mannose-6-phosphate isomerase